MHLRGDPEISNLKKIVYSPTFVMLAYGQEVGRIVGYQGSDLFWMQLEPLMAKAGFATLPIASAAINSGQPRRRAAQGGENMRITRRDFGKLIGAAGAGTIATTGVSRFAIAQGAPRW